VKFFCEQCKAKYQIADEKVAGRTLRMTCRRCKQEIVIHGDPAAGGQSAYGAANPASVYPLHPTPQPPPPPPSPLGADFHMQVAGQARTQPPVAPPIDEWHVGINDVPVGPMRREEIARKLAAGAITPDSLAWREGLDDWLPLRRIPELAVLCGPALSLPPPPALSGAYSGAPAPLQPAQRAELAPMGGRAGAAPQYVLEDWAPVADAGPHSQVAVNPLQAAGVAERRTSWPVMFALAGGFAFLMSALAITGARWLIDRQAVPVAAPAASAEAARPQLELHEQAGGVQSQQGTVIALDDPGLQNQRAAAARARGTEPNRAQQGKPKKELTEEQKAMLARMGGAEGSAVPNLRQQGTTAAAPAQHGSGGLTAAQLSQVVLRGREQLQRCYETALRGSGSTETVRMDVEVTVSAAGNVTSVKAGGQGLPGMSQCIEHTVHMWRFPTAGEATPTKFPVVFQPGS
jgi:hypothetical protein